MSPLEQEIIDALQNKNHVFVKYGIPLHTEFSEWMTEEEATRSKYWRNDSPWYLIDRDTYNCQYKNKR